MLQCKIRMCPWIALRETAWRSSRRGGPVVYVSGATEASGLSLRMTVVIMHLCVVFGYYQCMFSCRRARPEDFTRAWSDFNAPDPGPGNPPFGQADIVLTLGWRVITCSASILVTVTSNLIRSASSQRSWWHRESSSNTSGADLSHHRSPSRE